MTELANKCPGCGDLGVQQIINEFFEPEWCLGDVLDEDGDRLFICFCPYCGHKLQDPATAPMRVNLTKLDGFADEDENDGAMKTDEPREN